jgi:predicted CopG family antitoxin
LENYAEEPNIKNSLVTMSKQEVLSMSRKLTITLDDEIYVKLHEFIGRGKISQFIETLVRPQIMPKADLASAYRQMARDEIRETAALEWAEATIGDVNDETR